MIQCDLNADLGEAFENDEALMPYITSANIGCGFHASGEDIIRKTILLCQKYNVFIGAHPSYQDKENFGRKDMDISPDQVYQWVREQLVLVKEIAGAYNAKLHHVKPHGALYNKASKDTVIAHAIASAVKDINNDLILYGLSGSELIREGIGAGLKTYSEVFADRTYQDDGSLTPRSEAHSMIENVDRSLQQVLEMIEKGYVTSVSGKQVPIIANTICIHGDGEHAVTLAKRLREVLDS